MSFFIGGGGFIPVGMPMVAVHSNEGYPIYPHGGMVIGHPMIPMIAPGPVVVMCKECFKQSHVSDQGDIDSIMNPCNESDCSRHHPHCVRVRKFKEAKEQERKDRELERHMAEAARRQREVAEKARREAQEEKRRAEAMRATDF